MKRVRSAFFAAVLAALPWLAHATFELEDPQAELEAWQESVYSKNEDGSHKVETHLMRCELSADKSRCDCVKKETEAKLDISLDACRELVEKRM